MTTQTLDDNLELHSFNDEPAIIMSDGTMVWYKHGKIHRESGPAVIFKNNDVSFYYEHKWYIFHEWIDIVSLSEELKMELMLSYA